jgi:hypothetical protein
MTNKPNALAQTADFEFAALNEARNYREALIHDFAARLHGNVLEVGAGIGQITSSLRDMPGIEHLSSIEPDPKFCTLFRTRLPECELHQGTISDFESRVPWNAILSINVLEHIESDQAELSAYQRLLHPANGALCLFVPARPEIYAPIDRDFGHFRRYTRPELKRKLTLAGFKIVKIRYYNFVGYFLWWMNFRCLRKRYFDVASVKLFDRAVFPVIHRIETMISAPPIGQSLMVIATAA